MGLFFKKKKADTITVNKPSREDLLNKNENVPFSTLIKDDKADSVLAYKYENVKCTITGNVNGMKEGAILYVRRDGVLANVIKEPIAQINSEKLRAMVNDFFDKDRFTTVRAKYVSVDDNYLFCNLGFYMDKNIDDDEDEEEEEEEE